MIKLVFQYTSAFVIGLVSSCMLYGLAEAAERLPEVAIMPGMDVQWVSEYMIYNGHPMSIRNFQTSRTEEDVLRFYQSAWKSSSLAEIKETRMGDIRILGMEKDDHYITVQVQSRNYGSEGSLIVTRNTELKQKELDFPVMRNTMVISRIESIDLGQEATTLSLSNYQSISSNKSWYINELEKSGWVQKVQIIDFGMSDDVVEFQRGNQACQIQFFRSSPIAGHRSTMLIHWIKG